ncbi:hypothetical protein PAPYR_2494 [Paratrimastix pyriformis]|uniref:Uncharacterized protein n=1 Tax=Paratrimastix pyriformis TaxID=342808 RepID=A0ABQ8UPE8_9EUKA|nr:hypothetical protein PAPYR_2494 [Paratrimastix pyriformis]
MRHALTNVRNPAIPPMGMEEALAQFGPSPGAQAMMTAEREAAEEAIRTGIYGVWRYTGPQPEKGHDFCSRIGPQSRCFCGHTWSDHHQRPTDRMRPDTTCQHCSCVGFYFVPTRPEEIGEYWLPRRPEFNVATWRAKCRCGHDHMAHDPSRHDRPCRQCRCCQWDPHYCCVVCNQMGKDHESVWETTAERQAQGYPVGPEFIPLAEAPQIGALSTSRLSGTRGAARTTTAPLLGLKMSVDIPRTAMIRNVVTVDMTLRWDPPSRGGDEIDIPLR